MRNNNQIPSGSPESMERPDILKTLKLLLRYSSAEKKRFSILVTLTLVLTGLGLVIPGIISEAIDWISRIHVDKTFRDLAMLLLMTFGLYLIQVVLAYWEELVSARYFLNVGFRMREDYLRKITGITIAHLDTCRQGDLLSRGTNDIEMIVKLLSETLMKLVTSVVLFVGILAIMLTVSWRLTLVCVCSTVVTFLVSGIMGSFIRKHATKQQTLLGSINGYLEDCLHMLKSIKLYNRERHVTETFAGLSDTIRKESVYSLRWLSAVAPVNNFIGNVNFFIIAVWGGAMAVSGTDAITVASIVLFILYVREYTQTLNDLSEIIAETQTAVAAAERFFAVLDAPEEFRPESDQKITSGRVDLKNVRFSYTADVPVLSGIDMHIESGQSVAIVGASGCGKTTLIQLLLRFYEADNGSITVDGKDIRELAVKELRENIIAVMQDDIVLDESLAFNLSYGHGEEETLDADMIAEYLNLDVAEVPDSQHLSRGQIQKICVMRAFFVKAKILILDESMSLVDPVTYDTMYRSIRKLFPDATIITITHQLSCLRDCDRIFCMSDGRIVEEGTFDELMEKNGEFYKMLKFNQ